MEQKPLDKMIAEIYSHYPDAIDRLVDTMWKKRAQEPVIGSTTDETLSRTYMQEGYFQALRDILNEFKP